MGAYRCHPKCHATQGRMHLHSPTHVILLCAVHCARSYSTWMARRAKVMGEAGEEEGVGTVLFTLCYVFFIHRFMLIKCISAHHTQCLLTRRRGCVHSRERRVPTAKTPSSAPATSHTSTRATERAEVRRCNQSVRMIYKNILSSICV